VTQTLTAPPSASTPVESPAAGRRFTSERGIVALLVAAGLVGLWTRPTLITLADPPMVLAILFGGLLAAGLVVPLPTRGERPNASRAGVIGVTVIGIAAVVGAQLLVGHARTVPLAGRFVFLDIVAAVAEEAFFRRLVFGLLRPHGATLAIWGTAAMFAVVHLTTYGAWVLPLDFAVGLLFGWQRETSGSWLAPAATHVLANLLVVW
jgi:membrane protease YdiL (CAAX protease family)